MNKEDTERVKELLSAPKNIVIVTHKNPDGDAIASTLALHHYLLFLHWISMHYTDQVTWKRPYQRAVH